MSIEVRWPKRSRNCRPQSHEVKAFGAQRAKKEYGAEVVKLQRRIRLLIRTTNFWLERHDEIATQEELVVAVAGVIGVEGHRPPFVKPIPTDFRPDPQVGMR